VREAIGIMFNFEWSNETLFYGLYDRVTSFWENSDLAAKGLPSEAEQEILRPLVTEGLLPETILTAEAVVPAVWGDRRADRANQRRAGELLDAAGWTLGTDQLRRNAAGQTLKVEILNDSQTFDRVYIPYIENMRKVGIDAVMVKIDNSQMEARERPPAYDFDMVTGGVMTGLFPGSELKQVFGSETTRWA
jgi:microcin C transport system substrate-binding protein